MNATLLKWIVDADAVRHVEYFQGSQTVLDLSPVRTRVEDYYISLVGELFDQMRTDDGVPLEWSRLGNAFAQIISSDYEDLLQMNGIVRDEGALFAAAAFYCGGFPASAYLTLRGRRLPGESEYYQACFDFLGRPNSLTSTIGRTLFNALRDGDLASIRNLELECHNGASIALALGPSEWIPARLLEKLVTRFTSVNIRAVLPDGQSDFWNPLVSSFIGRTPPTWEFFPSQRLAIQSGLIDRNESFSLQMPIGSGKTTLCETLLFSHLQRNPLALAVLIVPFRSLASELRGTLVRHLNAMGITSRCAYGGTVPTGTEVHSLAETRALVATPESLAGLLSADATAFRRISLVICDEGHLLDGGGRGISLELLLARLKSREGVSQHLLFVS